MKKIIIKYNQKKYNFNYTKPYKDLYTSDPIKSHGEKS